MARLERRLSLSEHEEFGRDLHQFHEKLTRLMVKISNTYGTSTKEGRRLNSLTSKTATALGNLRSALDDRVYDEYPERGHPANAYVYYPGANRRTESQGSEPDR